MHKKFWKEAGRSAEQAGIPLAGGHTIDSMEPMFGLAVTGMVDIESLKKNDGAKAGDLLFLTKSIGVGILSTAGKRGVLEASHEKLMLEQMISLNSVGEKISEIKGVTAMTDVTGFGLLGHLIEMAEGAGLSAEIDYASLPVIDGAKEYLTQRIVPDATYRNWNSYSKKVSFEKGVNVMEAFNLLPDPQTNGGLLIACDASGVDELKKLLARENISIIEPIGRFISKEEKSVLVKI